MSIFYLFDRCSGSIVLSESGIRNAFNKICVMTKIVLSIFPPIIMCYVVNSICTMKVNPAHYTVKANLRQHES